MADVFHVEIDTRAFLVHSSVLEALSDPLSQLGLHAAWAGKGPFILSLPLLCLLAFCSSFCCHPKQSRRRD